MLQVHLKLRVFAIFFLFHVVVFWPVNFIITTKNNKNYNLNDFCALLCLRLFLYLLHALVCLINFLTHFARRKKYLIFSKMCVYFFFIWFFCGDGHKNLYVCIFHANIVDFNYICVYFVFEFLQLMCSVIVAGPPLKNNLTLFLICMKKHRIKSFQQLS